MRPKLILIALILISGCIWNKSLAQEKWDTIPEPAKKNADGIFYEPFETLPEFPGGFEAFKKFVQSNLKKIKGAAGKRLVAYFVVEKDGSLTDIKILRGINEDANDEAIRVLKLSPKWKPGTQNKIVRSVAYSIPITFEK